MKTPLNEKQESLTDAQVRKRTILSFTIFIVLVAAGATAWLWIRHQPKELAQTGVQPTLRKVLDANEKVFDKTFSPNHLVKTFPKSRAAKNVRVNGDVGMGDDFDANAWRLKLVRAAGDTLLIGIDEIRKLPKTEIVFDFKCIEGWSQITHWGGVKFSDFIRAYHLEALVSKKYIGLETPDGAYYVGIDMPSAMHPQTLLCYEMNDKPLPANQGNPLRLIIPVKYGIKSLKRIGTLFFSDERPRDYWYERGYDYYSAL